MDRLLDIHPVNLGQLLLSPMLVADGIRMIQLKVTAMYRKSTTLTWTQLSLPS